MIVLLDSFAASVAKTSIAWVYVVFGWVGLPKRNVRARCARTIAGIPTMAAAEAAAAETSRNRRLVMFRLPLD